MGNGSNFLAPRDSLIPPFPELDVAVDSLEQAAEAMLAGEFDRARHHLHHANIPLLRDQAMRAMGALDSEIHRLRRVPLPPKAETSEARMPGKAVSDQVFARDGWRCRFCGVRVVAPAARKSLASAVPDALCWQGSNKDLHAAFLYVSATLDHVVPHSRGGTNEMDNLVAACWPCNFGRGGYLLEQMGLNDPRQRPPNCDDWDGLVRLLRQPVRSKPARAEAVKSSVVQSPNRPLISAPDWLSQIEGLSEQVPDRMLAFLASCEGLPVSWSARDVLMLRLTSGPRTLAVFGFERSGAVQIPWYIGDAKLAFRPFAETLASLIPCAIAYETPKTWTVRHATNRTIHVEELLEAAKAVRDALGQLEEDLRKMSPPP